MPDKQRQLGRFSKSAIGCLLACLILSLGAMSVSPALHGLLHKDAAQNGHECAVTIFAHGKMDIAAVDVPVVVTPVVVKAPPAVEFSLFSKSLEQLPPGRAPPVLPSVS